MISYFVFTSLFLTPRQKGRSVSTFGRSFSSLYDTMSHLHYGATVSNGYCTIPRCFTFAGGIPIRRSASARPTCSDGITERESCRSTSHLDAPTAPSTDNRPTSTSSASDCFISAFCCVANTASPPAQAKRHAPPAGAGGSTAWVALHFFCLTC